MLNPLPDPTDLPEELSLNAQAQINPALSRAVSRAKTPEHFHAAVRASQAEFDALNSGTIAKLGVTLACCDGCWICCHLRVDVFAHEVFALADFIRKRFAPAELEALMGRLATHSEKVLAMQPVEHVSQNVRCPMLVEGSCSVYAARPLACRRHHSQELAPCQYTYDNPSDLDYVGARDHALFRTLSEAMQDGWNTYAALGYDPTIYELGTALQEALTNPATWRRWRDGKKAFLKASVTPMA